MSTLIVIAKEPVPGKVKTRLSPPFTPQQAAELAEAALVDTLRAVGRARADNRLLVLSGRPGSWLPPGFAVVPQVAGTLDVRIAAAFAEAAKRDSGPALLIGMDTPQVSTELLEKALLEMDGASDAVFGPAEDGGFWALGLHDPAHPRVQGLLLGVPMSQPHTGRVQFDRLVSADLRVAILPSLRDIDTADDAYAAADLIPDSAFARRLSAIAPASWNGAVSASYERALWLTLTQDVSCLPILLEGEDGESVRLDVARYAAAPDATDSALLDRCTGPTLDIGCGPGRLSAELARRGIPSLGVDVAPVALLLARAAGATTLRRSVFDPLPGEGRWPHALLIDGNIGIGGDPHVLLSRIKALLRPTGGELVVEASAEDVDERHRLRVDGRGTALPWARLGTSALRAVAEPLGYTLAAMWQSADNRHFVALTT